MAVNIPKPDARRPIVFPDFTQEDLFRDWINAITNQVNTRSLLFGNGSPEGNVEAIKGREYMDEAGTASNIMYVKRSDDVAGNKTLGWILV